jgi:hypothetical protein
LVLLGLRTSSHFYRILEPSNPLQGPQRARPSYGQSPLRSGLCRSGIQSLRRLPGSRACSFSACLGSLTTRDRSGDSRIVAPPALPSPSVHWVAAPNPLVHACQGHETRLTSLSMSADESAIISSDYRTVKQWDLVSGPVYENSTSAGLMGSSPIGGDAVRNSTGVSICGDF